MFPELRFDTKLFLYFAWTCCLILVRFLVPTFGTKKWSHFSLQKLQVPKASRKSDRKVGPFLGVKNGNQKWIGKLSFAVRKTQNNWLQKMNFLDSENFIFPEVRILSQPLSNANTAVHGICHAVVNGISFYCNVCRMRKKTIAARFARAPAWNTRVHEPTLGSTCGRPILWTQNTIRKWEPKIC